MPALSAVFIMFSCNSPSIEKEVVYINTDDIIGNIVADTIIYDVIIKNRDKTDLWKDECLQYLNKDAFIDSIFTAVYNGRHIAYDLFTNEEIPAVELKKLEANEIISRDKIGKIQFREVWYLSSEHMVMKKKILSLILGMEVYSETGEFRDYKPVFRINFN